jgi:hypothetical protein
MTPTKKEVEKRITVLLTTADYFVRGELTLPDVSVVENPTTENLLFYMLNSGAMFLSLRNCVLTNRFNMDFQPEEIKYYNINLNIVHSCRIIN